MQGAARRRSRFRDRAAAGCTTLSGGDGDPSLKSNQNSIQGTAAPDARDWVRILASYRSPRAARGIIELAITAVGSAWCRLLAMPASRCAGRGISGPAVHDPARLR